jgi:hypothetical protein
VKLLKPKAPTSEFIDKRHIDHGFLIRGNLELEVTKKECHQALNEIYSFFQNHSQMNGMSNLHNMSSSGMMNKHNMNNNMNQQMGSMSGVNQAKSSTEMKNMSNPLPGIQSNLNPNAANDMNIMNKDMNNMKINKKSVHSSQAGAKSVRSSAAVDASANKSGNNKNLGGQSSIDSSKTSGAQKNQTMKEVKQNTAAVEDQPKGYRNNDSANKKLDNMEMNMTKNNMASTGSQGNVKPIQGSGLGTQHNYVKGSASTKDKK